MSEYYTLGQGVWASWRAEWKPAIITSVRQDGYAVMFDHDLNGTYHRDVTQLMATAPAPHADYPGGADQYAADVATLAEAGAWRLEPSDLPCDDPVVNVAEDAWDNIVNALDAAGRFVPYVLAWMGGAS